MDQAQRNAKCERRETQLKTWERFWLLRLGKQVAQKMRAELFESTPKMLKWSLTVPGNRRAAKPYSVPKIKYNAFF